MLYAATTANALKLSEQVDLLKNDNSVSQREFLQTLINTYKSVRNVGNILNIINSLDNNKDDRIKNFRILFEQMQKNDDLYSIELMTLVNSIYLHNAADLKNEDFKYIYDNLPSNVKSFPWGNTKIAIHNVRWPEQICVYNGKDESLSNHAVTRTNSKQSCVWQIVQSGEQNSFSGFRLIQVAENSSVLYAGNNNELIDDERRHVFGDSVESFEKNYYGGDLWMFEPLRNGNYRIYNIFYDEYLYALDTRESTRQILLWRPYGCDGSACEFKIQKNLDKCEFKNLQPLNENDGINEIQNIICGAYQKTVTNFQKIVEWIDGLENKNQQSLAYRALFEEMSNNNDLYTKELMTLIYHLRVRDLINSSDSNIKYIFSNIPSQVRNFPWDDQFTIKNRRFYGERVCSYRTKDQVKSNSPSQAISNFMGSSCVWRIKNNTEWFSFGFRLYDSISDDFLYAGNNSEVSDSERRNVFASDEKSFVETHRSGDKWMIEPRRSGYFRIFNYDYKEYLYPLDVANYDRCKMKRPQLLWRPYGCDGSQCEFSISKYVDKIDVRSTQSDDDDDDDSDC